MATNPAFIPLGEPSVRRLAANPASVPLGGRLIPHSEKNPFPRLRGKVAEGRKGGIKTQRLPHLAANPASVPLDEPSIFAAWWQTQHPPRLRGKVAEGWKGGIKTQRLPRLAANLASIPLAGSHHPAMRRFWKNCCSCARHSSSNTPPLTSWMWWLCCGWRARSRALPQAPARRS